MATADILTHGARATAGPVDFPAWYAAGCYGGLLCGLLVALLLATYAVRRRQGTPRQLAFAMAACLLGSLLNLGSIWWEQNRLDLAGPTLAGREVLAALVWVSLWGWGLPVLTLGAYILFTERSAGVGWSRHLPAVRLGGGATVAAGSDGAVGGNASGHRVAWGRLVPLSGAGHPYLLARPRVLLGREPTNDLILTDERASRQHLEILWDHGHPYVADLGSMNGTLVNGRPARERTLLHDGDEIAIGDQRFRFELVNGLVVPPGESAADAATAKIARLARTAPPTVPLRYLALVGTAGRLAGRRWLVRGPVVTIGRDPACMVCLGELSVSRLHAQVMVQPDGAYLTDLQSSNGTYRNGERLTAPQALQPGDTLVFGTVELRCEAALGNESEPTARTTSGPLMGPTSPPTVALDGLATQRPGAHPGQVSTPRLGIPLDRLDGFSVERRTRPPDRKA